MLLESREAWKLITDFDDTVLIGLEEKADIAVVYYRYVFVLCCFFGCELYVGIYPSLITSDLDMEWCFEIDLLLKRTVLLDQPIQDSRHQLQVQPCQRSTLFHLLFRPQCTLPQPEEVV